MYNVIRCDDSSIQVVPGTGKFTNKLVGTMRIWVNEKSVLRSIEDNNVKDQKVGSYGNKQ